MNCPLCSEKISFAGWPKHLFSAKHREDILELIRKKASLFKLRQQNKRLFILPIKDENYNCCLGCKKVWTQFRTPEDHLGSCKEAAKHHDGVKKWLETALKEEEKGEVAADAGASEEVEKLRKRVAKLEKDVAWWERQGEKASDDWEEMEEKMKKLFGVKRFYAIYDLIKLMEDKDEELPTYRELAEKAGIKLEIDDD